MAALTDGNTPDNKEEEIEESAREFEMVVVVIAVKVAIASGLTSFAVFTIPDKLETTFVTESAVASSLLTTADNEVNRVDLKDCWEANSLGVREQSDPVKPDEQTQEAVHLVSTMVQVEVVKPDNES